MGKNGANINKREEIFTVLYVQRVNVAKERGVSL